MSSMVEQVADALLYEGYLLYPYRRTAVKNRQRFSFGVLYPESYVAAAEPGSADRSFMQIECLLLAAGAANLTLKVRFLQLVGGCQEAVERAVLVDYPLAELLAAPRYRRFAFRQGQSVAGEVELTARPCDAESIRVRARITNRTALPGGSPSRDQTLALSLVSCHAILTTSSGEFVSLLDPPGELAQAATACENIGAWPVLVGEPGGRDTLLASPIILYDYPTIAPESPGDLFDGTEIDEILSLRILTLTDDEKRELRQSDDRARRLLERTEALTAEDLMRLHGVLREPGRPEGRRA
jgi:hypothetical protein